MHTRYIRKTKNFFINKNLQGKAVLTIFLMIIASCMIFALLLGIFSADTMTISYSDNDFRIGATPWILFKNAVAANWVFLITGGIFLVLVAIVATHRIAGPLYHLEKSVLAMSEGDIAEPIYLRANDEGKGLAEKVNLFNEVLRDKLTVIESHTEQINTIVSSLQKEETQHLDINTIITELNTLQYHNDQIQTAVHFFRFHKK